MIQGLIYGQFTQHEDLCDAQGGLAVGGVEGGGEGVEHFAGGAQGLAGVGEQGFGVVDRVGQVHRGGFVDAAHDVGAGAEIMVQRAFGGFCGVFSS